MTLFRDLELGLSGRLNTKSPNMTQGRQLLQFSRMRDLHIKSSLCPQTVRMRMTRRQHPAGSPAAQKRQAAAAS